MLIGIALIVAFVSLLLASDALPSSFRYRIDERGIRILLFGRYCVKRIPIEDIESISKESWQSLVADGSFRRGMHFSVRITSAPVVIWRKERGPIFVDPPDPTSFIADVSGRLEAHLKRTAIPEGSALASKKLPIPRPSKTEGKKLN